MLHRSLVATAPFVFRLLTGRGHRFQTAKQVRCNMACISGRELMRADKAWFLGLEFGHVNESSPLNLAFYNVLRMTIVFRGSVNTTVNVTFILRRCIQ